MESEHPFWYYAFASPEAYLSAERILHVVDGPCEWTPIRSPLDQRAFRCAEERQIAEQRIELLAAERELQPLRWPPDFDEELALRAATFAKSIGRGASFALAALRQAYAGGADLGDRDIVLIAAAACEMHPRAVLSALDRDSVVAELDAATALAHERGVRDVPALWLPDGTVLHGDAALGELVT